MKIISTFFWIIFSLLFASCYFFESVDESTLKPVTAKPKIENFIGKWKADTFSYNFFKQKDKSKIVEIEIFEDGNVIFNNFIFSYDFINKEYSLENITGKWFIKKHKFKNRYTLSIVLQAKHLINNFGSEITLELFTKKRKWYYYTGFVTLI